MPWYDYASKPGGGSSPLVAIVLWNGSKRVRLAALVDSGADCSLFDAGFADVLGLDRSQADVETVVGASGSAFKCLHWPNARLEIQFGNDRFPFDGRFADFPQGADAQNLLGRSDFFQKYIVQFWDAAEMMNIDLSPDFSNPPLS